MLASISKLKNTIVYKLPPIEEDQFTRVHSETDPISYKVVSDGREICEIRITIDGQELVIDDMRLINRNAGETLLKLIRYAIDDLLLENPVGYFFLRYEGEEDKERAFRGVIPEAIIGYDSDIEVYRDDYDICLLRLLEFYTYLTEETNNINVGQGEPYICDDREGYPVILRDTDEDNIKLWFKYMFDESDESFYFQAAYLNVETGEFDHYFENKEGMQDIIIYGDYIENMIK